MSGALTALRIVVSTETLTRPAAERTATADMFEHDTLARHRAQIVGPVVDVTPDAQLSKTFRSRAKTRAQPVMELSITYNPKVSAVKARRRMVTFDKATGHWVDVGPQTEYPSTHLIRARVSGVGRFSIVEMASGTDADALR
jgi:hypothetical protein